MAHVHHLVFLVLASIVAVLGSWTALDLFRRVRSHAGRARGLWLGAAATAMGISIWSMHFIAMLAFDPGSPVRYDLPLTFVSLAVAIGATGGAFFVGADERAKLWRVFAAGAAMGAGICLMHYVGMAALRTAVSLGYDPALVALSLVVAIAAATAALFAGRQERSLLWRAAAAPTLGLAIVGMHYTAMAALRLTPGVGAAPAPGAPPIVIAVSVTAGAILVLLLALLASMYDQRLNVLAALEAGGVGYWELALPYRVLHFSPKARQILGFGPDEPISDADMMALLTPEARMERADFLGRLMAGHGVYDAEYQLRTAPGEPVRWVNVRGRVVASGPTGPRRMAGVLLDISDRRAAFAAVEASERRQRLLIDELNHRVKNTLATVQSLARQTGKRASDVEAYLAMFESRLMALSQTHNALTRGSWEAASLRELLQVEFEPFPREQYQFEGPEVALAPRQALALGLVFHELATNAAKYGALSVPSGLVRVSWSVTADKLLLFQWREADGPAVKAPARRGFGSRLVEASVGAELGGRAELTFHPEGFRCRLEISLAEAPDALLL